MSASFLVSKIHTPSTRIDTVKRPRLLQQLNDGINSKMSLVSAPAGFGKTTTVIEWIRQTGRPVAWLSLDEQDNDPSRFLSYLIRAIQNILPGFGESVLDDIQNSIQNGKSQRPNSLSEMVLNEIAEIQSPFIFVLDDYHVITNPVIQDIFRFLIDSQPDKMHLIITTRTDPSWPLGRLRARRDINEIRASDLRFTPQEAAEFLNERTGLNLTEQEVITLEKRTEGWIAALQLAALSMMGQSDNHKFIENLAGSHRFISDYLVEEVLEKQPPGVQEFLLKTSILQQMNASLCDELMGHQDSQSVLLYIEQSNLFLQALDNERCWYRYHHLFADLLRVKLEQTHSDWIPGLHQCASKWFEKQGLMAEAVQHSISAHDYQHVVILVEKNAFSILDMGELTTLTGWLDTIPRDLMLNEPWMSVFYAWALAYTGQYKVVEEHLLHAESVLNNFPEWGNSSNKRNHIKGHIAAIRTMVSKNNGKMLQAIEFADLALKFLSDQDDKTRCFVAAMQGNAQLFCEKPEEAAQSFQIAIQAGQKAGETHMAVHVLCDLAGLQILLGQLRNAEISCLQALHLAEHSTKYGKQPAPGADFAHARLSGILLKRNEIDKALINAEKSLLLSKQRGQADITFFCLLTMAEVLHHKQDLSGALATLQIARQMKSGAAWHLAIIEQYEVSIKLAHGDINVAEDWLAKLDWKLGDEIPDGQGMVFNLVAQILMAKNENAAALKILEQLLVHAQATGAIAFVLNISVLQALAWQALGDMEQALTALKRALSLGESEGYVGVFMEKPAQMHALLHQVAAQGIHEKYIRLLLTALEDSTDGLPTKVSVFDESFSEREMEVLRLLGSDLTSSDIANKLVICVFFDR